MADGPRATLTYEDSEDEEVNERLEEGEQIEVQADGRAPQYFIYKPKTRYPREKDEKRTPWTGPKCDPDNPEVILGYGIIVHSHNGFLEILTCTNVYNQHELKHYKPRFWKPTDMAEAVGCWLQLKLDVRSKEICAIPYPTTKLPLHTKVYQPRNGSNWDHQFLIYDCVRKAGQSQFVTSNLLGLIDDSDSCVTYDRNASVYNVEYLIESWLENGKCKIRSKVVKFHGSLELYTELPEALSYNRNPTTTTAWLRHSVQRMLLTEEELMAKKEANRNEKRARLMERTKRSAHLGYGDAMLSESSTPVNALRSPAEVEQNGASSRQFHNRDRPRNVAFNTSMPFDNMDDEDADDFLVDLDIESPDIEDNQTENETVSAHSSNHHSTKPTILITFSSTGYGFYLAKQYLKNGYNVVIHSVDPILEVEELKERLSGFLDSYIYVQGRLDNEFAATVVDGIVNKFRRIDVVLHLPTALHKVGTPVGSSNNLRYLIEENVQPLINIHKHVLKINCKPAFIVVPPVVNPMMTLLNAKNVDEMTTWLYLVVKEIDDRQKGIYAAITSNREFSQLQFEEPTIIHQIAMKIWTFHQMLDRLATWKSDERTIRIYGESLVKSIHLDDIVDVKTSKNHDLKFVAYPLIENKRTKRVFEVDCTEADEFRETLVHRLRPPTPPHRPSQSAIDSRRIIVIANSVSERANHAVEIMQKLDINDFTAICVLSGDGVVTEVIRGLLTRSDRDRALRVPILHIPCGTSNALAAAMAFKSGEPFSPRGNFCKELALFIAHPVYCSLSLQHVETESDGHWPMFMTTAYGLIADIDLGSERFRWAGLARLHIEAFIRIARLPTLARYRVRISYKPVNDKQTLRRSLIKARDIWQKLGTEHFTSGNVEIVDDTTKKLQNDSIRLVEEAFAGTHLDDVDSIQDTTTPTLADPIPTDWITIEGDFAFVCLFALYRISDRIYHIFHQHDWKKKFST
ncbi:DAGKc domain-containing protein [Aphelenchoides besseyi]|nr:DAGKc domain-containing protein [Aphelenchoides besseyi]